jgi:N-acetylglucosaminyldiphosphoundecaprenol N-acetyl-beta-D-mannosaminyltransferase
MPPRVNILGLGISSVSLDETVRQVNTCVKGRSRQALHFCTVHTVMECFRDPRLRNIINQADLAAPDGMPLVWFCRFQGHKEVTRVYGPDLMLAFCEHSVAGGYRHFFYGGAPGVAEKLAVTMQQRYPGLQVAGTYSPPFRPVGAIEEAAVIAKINALQPDIIWVGLGTPKQDYWLAQHRPMLNAPVLVAVGAAFDMLSGSIPQAPRWMQRAGLEWLFRLRREPRRLAYRYLVYNPLFMMHVFLQLTGLRQYPRDSHRP